MGICVSRVPTPPFLWGPYFPAQTSICTLLHHSGTAAPHLHVGPRTSQQDPSYLHFKTNLPLCYLPSSRSSTVLRPTYYVYAACTYVLPVCVYIYIYLCVCACAYTFTKQILQYVILAYSQYTKLGLGSRLIFRREPK